MSLCLKIGHHEIQLFVILLPEGYTASPSHQDVAESLGATLTPRFVHTEGHVLSTFLRVFPGERSTCRQELILAVSRGAVSFNGINYPMIFFMGYDFFL